MARRRKSRTARGRRKRGNTGLGFTAEAHKQEARAAKKEALEFEKATFQEADRGACMRAVAHYGSARRAQGEMEAHVRSANTPGGPTMSIDVFELLRVLRKKCLR